MPPLFIAVVTFLYLLELEYKTALLETYLKGEWRVGEGEVA